MVIIIRKIFSTNRSSDAFLSSVRFVLLTEHSHQVLGHVEGPFGRAIVPLGILNCGKNYHRATFSVATSREVIKVLKILTETQEQSIDGHRVHLEEHAADEVRTYGDEYNGHVPVRDLYRAHVVHYTVQAGGHADHQHYFAQEEQEVRYLRQNCNG